MRDTDWLCTQMNPQPRTTGFKPHTTPQMKMPPVQNTKLLRQALCLAAVAMAASMPARAQTPAPSPAPEASAAPEVVLDPFTVTTSKDKGYAATNVISGSRVDTAIKDLPIPVQVITSEFIDDIGATNLRDALAYSSGIMVQTQNDLENSGGTYGSPYGPGGVNNPQGLTSNINQVQLKIRGFVTDNVLRDGFLRGNSTDSLNIDRIEVVAGPNSLLYGTGNFGGVVDYLIKQPMDTQQGEMNFTYGTYDFMRGAIDVTGPISAANHIDYRLGMSWESSGTQIQYQKNSHYFIAPSVSWKPTPTTTVLVDTEYGSSKQNGYSFQAFRAVEGGGSTPINNDQIEAVAFFFAPGANPRTFNLSGPNTYDNQQENNIEIKLTQQLLKETEFLPAVNFLVGFNRASWNVQTQGDETGPWTQAVYDQRLPANWRGWAPFHEAWLAGLAGRDEMLAHGTAADARPYLGQPYFPGTPTDGCLTAQEFWSADGRLQRSDQLALVRAYTRSGVDHGYLVVVEIDDAARPVVLEDVLETMLAAERQISARR